MDNFEKLYSVGKAVRQNAYAPYSKFKVGAAILTETGKIYSGCNVENASYPCGTCAEAGAISAMIADGEYKIAKLLIVADADNILPCGNCLQKIAEFGHQKTIIYCANLQKVCKKFYLNDLLPQNFTLR